MLKIVADMLPRRVPSCLAFCLAATAAASGTALSAQTRYIAFGDSITCGIGDNTDKCEDKGYPVRLETLLRATGLSVTVENFGVGGEDTVEAMLRIRNVLSGGGDVFLLMEGTNDITKSATISLETTQTNLAAMARLAEQRGMRVVHATTIPRLPNVTVDYRNVLTQRLAQGVRDEAGLANRRLADPFEVFSTQPSAATRLYYPFEVDKDPAGHPSPAGYDLLATIFFDVETRKDAVPPVLGLTTPRAGATGVAVSTPLAVDVWDFGSGLDRESLALTVNGAAVATERTGEGALVALRPLAPPAWSGVVRVGLKGRDSASPPNEVDREVLRFVTAGTQLLDGDFDQDGRVDGRDLFLFALHFGAKSAQKNRYLAAADFNGDGVIDGVDLAVVAANFGRSAN
jgi:lysophospholipase L1-like esterase